MNLKAISKAINPYVVNDELTYDDFDKILGFRRERKSG